MTTRCAEDDVEAVLDDDESRCHDSKILPLVLQSHILSLFHLIEDLLVVAA